MTHTILNVFISKNQELAGGYLAYTFFRVQNIMTTLALMIGQLTDTGEDERFSKIVIHLVLNQPLAFHKIITESF